MRIQVVARSWPLTDRSGLALAAAGHVRMLADAGHKVSIVGTSPLVLGEDLPVAGRTVVQAAGSGALYSPKRVDLEGVLTAIERDAPELIVVEAWQTALTEAYVCAAHALRIPVLMISHGVSVDAFAFTPVALVRAVAWQPYRWWTLPRLVSKLSAITTLDEYSRSPRFGDRDLARKSGVPVVPLRNAPIHWSPARLRRSERAPVVLVIGYYSWIKNQRAALRVATKIRDLPVRFKFIGRRQGRYFQACHAFARELDLLDRVTFLDDTECDLSKEMGAASALLCTSLTEALPITVIEAMASGTPFVSTRVGAVPSLQGGLTASSTDELALRLRHVLLEGQAWADLACDGIEHYERLYTERHVAESLRSAVDAATSFQQ